MGMALFAITKYISMTFLKGVDIVALVCAALLFPIPAFWLVIHPAIHFWRRFGNRSFWVAIPVWITIDVAVVLLRNPLFSTRIHRNFLTWIIGVMLLVLTAWIERQTRRAFGLRRLVGLPEMNPAQNLSGLVQSGIYEQVRHPRYVAYMLTLLATAFLTGAEGIILLAILNILLYQIVAPLEERELLQHYGPQYRDYIEAVPRFVPRLGRKTQSRVMS
jgi:protein-S-isoprenylcysteine O-methyltransferase Ste14